MTDAWTWRAVYKDGSSLGEFDGGTDHGWAEIDLDRLSAFVLEPSRPGLCPHVLRVSSDTRAIFFRRRVIEDVTNGNSGVSFSITVLGWQRTVEGRNVKAFTAFYEDGRAVVSDTDNF